MTPETRRKIQATLKGKPKPPDTRAKMARAKQGVARDPETKRRIAEGVREAALRRKAGGPIRRPRLTSLDFDRCVDECVIHRLPPPRHMRGGRGRKAPSQIVCAAEVAPATPPRVFLPRHMIDAYVHDLVRMLPARHHGGFWPNGVAEFIVWTFGTATGDPTDSTATLHGWRTIVRCTDEGPETHRGTVNLGGALRPCHETTILLNHGTPDNYDVADDVTLVAMVAETLPEK